MDEPHILWLCCHHLLDRWYCTIVNVATPTNVRVLPFTRTMTIFCEKDLSPNMKTSLGNEDSFLSDWWRLRSSYSVPKLLNALFYANAIIIRQPVVPHAKQSELIFLHSHCEFITGLILIQSGLKDTWARLPWMTKWVRIGSGVGKKKNRDV